MLRGIRKRGPAESSADLIASACRMLGDRALISRDGANLSGNDALGGLPAARPDQRRRQAACASRHRFLFGDDFK
jgi:hypothetical protein